MLATRPTAARRGITLLEVLAAIFIMGIGTLAILVLFPLAALNMAQALQDDRTAHIASNADAMATARDLRSDGTFAGYLTTPPAAGLLIPDPSGPSYPVFVDPYYAGSFGNVAGLSHLRRVADHTISGAGANERWYSMTDDVSFDPDGKPKNVGGLERQGYFTYSYMLKRNVSGAPQATSLYVIVYRARPVTVPQIERAYTVAPTGNKGETSVTLTWAAGAAAPELRRGNWLFDSSYRVARPTPTARQFGYVNGAFYRVLEASSVSPTTMLVELEPPLRDNNVTQMVVLDGAVEVFERGTGR